VSDTPVRPLDVAAVAGNDVKVKMRDGLGGDNLDVAVAHRFSRPMRFFFSRNRCTLAFLLQLYEQ
jgi:hypothetical protein